ncbi:PII uridylyl-transferase (Uridylyl-removing enzyme) [gamma proteobacterium HdN1]|nr:PII uridylyl-transferase (Uridylyl-removing enzyme) [gamma proteobacterium HdN1]
MNTEIAPPRTPTIESLSDDPELWSPTLMAGWELEKGTGPALLRCALKHATQILSQRFAAQLDIRMIVRRRAWVMDRLLEWLWQQYDFGRKEGIALIAVGGYGRAELHPYSDIDVMILLESGDNGHLQESISAFVTRLWDFGLEVGQSVRSLDECVLQATADITVATNLMEARTICGNPTLCKRMLAMTGPSQLWPAKAFFAAKWHEQITRHRKYANTEYNLEPDIKNAPGGLRDIHVIGWVAKRYFDASRLSELVTHEFLTGEEYLALNDGMVFLWRVRFALHELAKRGENRLLFDYQRGVAKMLGFVDSGEQLGVELLMQTYFRVVQSVSQLNDMLLQHFDEAILRADEPVEIAIINRRFQARNGFIEVRHPSVFKKTPSALLELFVILAQTPSLQGIRASTIRLIRDSRYLVDEKFRNDIRNTALFMELMRSQNKLYTQLWRMKRYGVLGEYIPEFGRIIGQMQYDLFHAYTVDAHSLMVIRQMRIMQLPESRRDFPMEHIIYQRLPKIELLYIAGLLHDLSKGRNGDHSELGAGDAARFCEHHRLGKWDTQLVAWLVRYHLIMSITAQKQDVSDPGVILEFANKVQDQIHLDYLYALTVADISATNPSLWNNWKASLLRQLYTETRKALRRGLENPACREDLIDENKERARAVLQHRNADLVAVDLLWSQLEDDYFLRESIGNLVHHTEAILAHGTKEEPLVLVGKTDERKYQGATQVFIYAKDAPNLFAATVAALTQLNLTIADARIITAANQYTLDTYVIMEEGGAAVVDETRIEQIARKLRTTLADPTRFPDIVHRPLPRALKHFRVATEITLANDLDSRATVLDITTLDRPGLLAEIGKIFVASGVLIQGAKIATFGERAEDVFYITDTNGEMLHDPEFCATLKERLRERLDKPA